MQIKFLYIILRMTYVKRKIERKYCTQVKEKNNGNIFDFRGLSNIHKFLEFYFENMKSMFIIFSTKKIAIKEILGDKQQIE